MSIQWPLVIFTALAGTGSALYLFAVIGRYFGKAKVSDRVVTVASVASIALLVVGGCASVLHLSHAERILEALNHPTSGIFLEALFLGILVALIALFLIVAKRAGGDRAAAKGVAVVGGAVALAYLYILGQSYMMSSQPAWNTPLLPLSYAATAAVAGAAAYVLLAALLKQDSAALSLGGLALGIVGALSAAICTLYGVTSGVGAGDAAVLMWGAVVLVGSALPAVCGFAIWRKPQQAVVLASIALLGALVGVLGLRCAMWMAESAVQNLFALPRY